MDLQTEKESHCNNINYTYRYSKCTSNVCYIVRVLSKCANKSGSLINFMFMSPPVFLYNKSSPLILRYWWQTITATLSLPPQVPDDYRLYTTHHQENQHCCNCNSCHCQSRCTLSGYSWWDGWSVWEKIPWWHHISSLPLSSLVVQPYTMIYLDCLGVHN